MDSVQKIYSLVLGIVLGIVGVWGFFSQIVLGVFGVNTIQSVLHVIAAGFGIYNGTQTDGKTYNMVLGVIGVLLGVLGFVPGIKDLLMNLLNINMATTVLHLVIGIVSLGVYFGVKE